MNKGPEEKWPLGRPRGCSLSLEAGVGGDGGKNRSWNVRLISTKCCVWGTYINKTIVWEQDRWGEGHAQVHRHIGRKEAI